MLIVIEGLDGAGKSTQVRRLREYLTQKVGELEYIHFPRYDSPVYGKLISRFLRGDFGNIEQVHPQLVALLFAEDRHNAKSQMQNILDEHGFVLLDRYVYSNIAYQCAKLSDPLQAEELKNWIKTTEYQEFELPYPDINIFLDVPLNFVEQRLKENRAGADRDYLGGVGEDIHEADMNFQRKVRDIYREQLKEDKNFIRIDCADSEGNMLPANDIFKKVKDVIDSRIG